MERLMRESKYSLELCKRLRSRYPGVVILKNDPDMLQGFPDLTLLYGPYWGCLELKGDEFAEHQPNQDWYVDHLNRMSFGAFIFPENERAVLEALDRVFEPELVH
jgi:hypothetical protein